MPRFIALHTVPAEMGQDQLIAEIKTLVASLPEGTIWLNSWILPQEDRLMCEWEAPDAAAVRAALEPVAHVVPTQALHEVEWVDPAWFD